MLPQQWEESIYRRVLSVPRPAIPRQQNGGNLLSKLLVQIRSHMYACKMRLAFAIVSQLGSSVLRVRSLLVPELFIPVKLSQWYGHRYLAIGRSERRRIIVTLLVEVANFSKYHKGFKPLEVLVGYGTIGSRCVKKKGLSIHFAATHPSKRAWRRENRRETRKP